MLSEISQCEISKNWLPGAGGQGEGGSRDLLIKEHQVSVMQYH